MQCIKICGLVLLFTSSFVFHSLSKQIRSSCRRQQRNIRASGPLGGNSAIMSLGAPLELDSQGLPPSLPPTDAPSGQGDEDPMDSDLVGGDEDDGGRQHNLVDAEDGEARMDLTDDLLHKVSGYHRDFTEMHTTITHFKLNEML